MNPKSRQRLVLSLAGVAIIAGMWEWAVQHLYTMPEPAIAAFTSITTNAFYVIGAVVIFMVTGRLIYEWKNQTAATVVQEASRAVVEERLFRCDKLDPKDVDTDAFDEREI